ncbi:MAG: FCD domain-containing protein [Hydrogenophaga sp.]|uniref:GntR family transcriptional regulator n=1 Tax=Hydrogenophaga sp. TaxID=1904254 RepID=UPI0016BA46F6|nr:GntR family transcriptional regulator [Hydrogenophaga sp.]NIM41839.1 FCD domain-containing protein [Hydrogenophaga sp.]NIN27144.1 FCD domain-containing protein [Hydrogenophaga sp.]NIN31845.1 FCD domain-containing protein [Hydrogenophaga sp.]NIN56089.1 FCD domain-containing protein [Hydrogenophaga sp.]NIO52216.1 FCD domain-containing protein [Hydrogenophaga sp.]
MTAQLLRLESTPDLADQVYRALLDAISSGVLRPGQRIRQEELAERFAVSRQPVMQALRLLRKDGFVQDAPQNNGERVRGLQVASLDGQWIAQVYQVRVALDRLAVRLAAQRRVRIDPAVLAAGRAAEREGDVKTLIDCDLAFHTAVYRAAGNPLIEQSALLHWHHIRRAMGLALQLEHLRAPVWDEHEAIARAIAQGNAALAEALITDHSEKASGTLAEQIAFASTEPAPDATVQLRGPQLFR